MSAEYEQTVPIQEDQINQILAAAPVRDAVRVREVLAKARELKGLDLIDVATLNLFNQRKQVTQHLHWLKGLVPKPQVHDSDRL